MRALILLLLVVVAFLLIVKFYPTTSVEGGETATPAAAPSPPAEVEEPAQGRFLTRPEAAQEAPARAGEVPIGARAGETAGPTAGQSPRTGGAPPAGARAEPTVPEWLAQVEAPLVRDEGELRVAAALVHGGAEQVRAAVASAEGFPRARGLVAEAFALALDREPRAALDLASGIDEDALEAREKELLQAALGAKPALARPAAASAERPLVLAMEMRLAAAQGETLLAGGRAPEAVRVLSDLLLRELAAPWPADPEALARWSATLDAAQRQHRWSRRGDWPSVEMTVEPGDSLVAMRKRYIAQHPGRVMCVGLMRRANGIAPNATIQPGQVVRVPTDPVRMLVDLSSRWALYMIGDEVAGSWPVGIGKPGDETPVGEYLTKNKIPEPPWMKVGQDPIPYGDPRNPLGTRWIGWSQDDFNTSYGFHGTTEPESIGKASSDGCVRLRNEDVEVLFEILPEGALVLVRE